VGEDALTCFFTMRRLIAAAALLVLPALMPGYALADLGGADMTDQTGRTTGESYSARCGKKAEKCTASFKDGRLIVDNGDGILGSQVINVVTSRTCRQVSIIMPWVKSCYASQYDYDFVISYRSSDGSDKTALIALRPGYFHQGEEAYDGFNRDLQIWLKQVLRPIGPSVEVEIKPSQ